MKQHYIPRCYLKRFSDNKKSIWTYDKVNCKNYRASLMAVCCDDDIYTLSDEFVELNHQEGNENLNRLSIEKGHFADFAEPFFARLLREIDLIREDWVSGKERYRLNFAEKRELALHILTQYFRIPKIGEAMMDDYMRMEKAGEDMLKHIMASMTGNEEYRNLETAPDYEKAALHADISYLDRETIMEFASAMANNIFVFWVSKGNDFYTSDFPITVFPHVEKAPSLFMGLAQYGGEVTMPLSPSISLSVYDRKYFREKEALDGCYIEADYKVTRRHNLMRYMYARQHVFSYNNDFKMIDSIYRLEGKHHFVEPKHKTNIVSGLGKY